MLIFVKSFLIGTASGLRFMIGLAAVVGPPTSES